MGVYIPQFMVLYKYSVICNKAQGGPNLAFKSHEATGLCFCLVRFTSPRFYFWIVCECETTEMEGIIFGFEVTHNGGGSLDLCYSQVGTLGESSAHAMFQTYILFHIDMSY